MSSYGYVFALGLVFLCSLTTASSGNPVPVLLFGGESSDHPGGVNPLVKISQTEFEQILAKKVGGSLSPVVVFSKDNLCAEDLTRNKFKLQGKDSLTYLPAVDSPLTAFRNLPAYNVSEADRVESVLDGHLVIVPANDLTTVYEMYQALRESGSSSLFAITGKRCGYSRSERTRRAALVRDSTDTFLVSTERVLLYSSVAPYLKVGDENFTQLSTPDSSTIDGNGTLISPLRLIMVFGNASASMLTLRLSFIVATAGYYTLSEVEYEANDTSAVMSPSSEIVFPYNFSYHCSQNTVFEYTSSNATPSAVYLNITNMQVQIDATKFSDTYDCVGFTTIPIWTGVFVTSILALIMIWGITMILDIRTMDRFDDPKGKTITISASE